ncbi:hypothetical protein ACVXG7_14110 [Enterobacter hormaechei]
MSGSGREPLSGRKPARQQLAGGRVIKYHRTLGTTLNALIKAGLTISEVNEGDQRRRRLTPGPRWPKRRNARCCVLIAARKA